MSTSLYNCESSLSKDIGDYWRGTATGAGSTTTIVDTALCAKANDWITDDAYDYCEDMTGDTYNESERKISSLDNTTGTLTTLARAGAIGSGAIYRVHRLFNASDKRTALIHAAKTGFPHIHKPILDTTLTLTANAPTKDISTLGLAQNQPTWIEYCESPSATYPIWITIRDWTVTPAGILYLPENMPACTLRISGIGYLDFLKSSAVSTAWDSTIALDEPQIKILSAEAAIYLYNQMAGSWTAGGKRDATERLAYWMTERQKRVNQFGMPQPKPRTVWGV